VGFLLLLTLIVTIGYSQTPPDINSLAAYPTPTPTRKPTLTPTPTPLSCILANGKVSLKTTCTTDGPIDCTAAFSYRVCSPYYPVKFETTLGGTSLVDYGSVTGKTSKYVTGTFSSRVHGMGAVNTVRMYTDSFFAKTLGSVNVTCPDNPWNTPNPLPCY
jgi:hypothetical protein